MRNIFDVIKDGIDAAKRDGINSAVKNSIDTIRYDLAVNEYSKYYKFSTNKRSYDSNYKLNLKIKSEHIIDIDDLRLEDSIGATERSFISLDDSNDSYKMTETNNVSMVYSCYSYKNDAPVESYPLTFIAENNLDKAKLLNAMQILSYDIREAIYEKKPEFVLPETKAQLYEYIEDRLKTMQAEKAVKKNTRKPSIDIQMANAGAALKEAQLNAPAINQNLKADKGYLTHSHG